MPTPSNSFEILGPEKKKKSFENAEHFLSMQTKHGFISSWGEINRGNDKNYLSLNLKASYGPLYALERQTFIMEKKPNKQKTFKKN